MRRHPQTTNNSGRDRPIIFSLCLTITFNKIIKMRLNPPTRVRLNGLAWRENKYLLAHLCCFGFNRLRLFQRRAALSEWRFLPGSNVKKFKQALDPERDRGEGYCDCSSGTSPSSNAFLTFFGPQIEFEIGVLVVLEGGLLASVKCPLELLRCQRD